MLTARYFGGRLEVKRSLWTGAQSVRRPTARAGGAGPAERGAPGKRGGGGDVDRSRQSSPLEDTGRVVLEAAATRTRAARVILQKGKSGLFWGAGGNPIVYGGAVDRVTGHAPKNGDMVLLCDHNMQPMGFGAFNSDSMYRVRLLQTAAEAAMDPPTCLDAERLIEARIPSLGRVIRTQARLSAAAALRRRMGLPRTGPGETTGYRLVNSEGDRLSGLIVDVFGDYAVAQCTAAWAELRRSAIAAAILRALPGARGVLWRGNADLLRLEGVAQPPPPALFTAASAPGAAGSDPEGPGGVSEAPLAWVNPWHAAQSAAQSTAQSAEQSADGQPPPAEAAVVAAEEGPSGAVGSGAAAGGQPPDEVEVRESGVRYRVSLQSGQKTGFYFDQRENRNTVREFARGARVLDLCCYSGGFAMSAALGGASHVTAVDSSAAALRLAAANAELNGVSGVCAFVEEDVMEFLTRAVDALPKSPEEVEAARAGAAGGAHGEAWRMPGQYEIVILDPPKLAPSAKSLPQATSRYRRLNELAAHLVAPGGVLLSCTCSGAMTQSGGFAALVAGAISAAGRTPALLRRGGAGGDHALHPGYPEGEYLTALFFGVSKQHE